MNREELIVKLLHHGDQLMQLPIAPEFNEVKKTFVLLCDQVIHDVSPEYFLDYYYDTVTKQCWASSRDEVAINPAVRKVDADFYATHKPGWRNPDVKTH